MNPCLLFIGPDRGRQEAELKSVLASLSAKDAPEVLKFYADQDDCESMLAAVRNESLFFNHLLAIVYRAEAFSAAALKLIAAYWKQPNPNSTVVFMSEEYGEVKDKFKFVPKDQVRVFWEVDEDDKPGWIRAYLRKNGASIEDEALVLLCELIESDTLSLQRESDTLMSYHPGGLITREDVEAYIFHGKEENTFTLFESLLGLDLANALSVLQKIISSQEADSIQIISGLAWQFRTFLSLKHRAGSGPASRDLFNEHRVRQQRTQAIYNRALREWNESDIERRILAIDSYDLLLRQARPGMHNLLLELMIYQMVSSPAFSRVLSLEPNGIFDV